MVEFLKYIYEKLELQEDEFGNEFLSWEKTDAEIINELRKEIKEYLIN